jgi:hypothetical protein
MNNCVKRKKGNKHRYDLGKSTQSEYQRQAAICSTETGDKDGNPASEKDRRHPMVIVKANKM